MNGVIMSFAGGVVRSGSKVASKNYRFPMPASTNHYAFTESGGTTLAVFTATYRTAEDLQQVLEMGVVEGASAAINQIDDLLAAA